MQTKPSYEELEQRIAALVGIVEQYARPGDVANPKREVTGPAVFSETSPQPRPAESRLHAGEEKFRVLAEYSPNMIFVHKAGRFLYVNNQCVNLMGYTRDEFYSAEFSLDNLLVPGSLVLARKSLKKHLLHNDIQPAEYTLIAKNGRSMDTTINTRLIDFEGDRAILGVVTDLTEQKQMERKLRNSENRFRAIFENTTNGIAVYAAVNDGDDFIFVDFNKAGERIEHVRKENIIGRSLIKNFPGAKKIGLIDALNRVWTSGTPEHISASFYSDGRISGWRDNYITKLPSGEIVVIYRDITQSKAAEDALKISEKKYRNLFESSIDPIYISRLDGTFVDVNHSFLDLFGYTRNEINDRNFFNLSANPEEQCKLRNLINKRDYIQDFDIKLINKDGKSIECKITANIRYENDGGILGYQGIIRDVTANKKAEKDLRLSRENLRKLSAKLIKAQEEERKRVSLELHDSLGQSLTAIDLGLTDILDTLGLWPDPLIYNKFREMHSIIANTSDRVSALSFALRPAILDDLGLLPTMRWHIRGIERKTKLKIELCATLPVDRLNPEVETVIYRISQEALNNIIKHAEAKQVTVRLEQQKELIYLEIKDDGKGFDVNEMLMGGQEHRIGLAGMQERATMIEGSLRIQSRRGEGTILSVEVPNHIAD